MASQNLPDSSKTLIILNPHAGSGKAGKLWSQIEPMLWDQLGELVVAVTQRPEEIAEQLEKARAAGLTRVIAIGGDGTNHAVVNELVRLNRQFPDQPRMTFGNLPIGTGRDWARTLGTPLSPVDAVRWIKSAHPAPLDIGQLTMETAQSIRQQHFLNIASAGIGSVIASRVNQINTRRPWTFYKTTIEALLTYTPPRLTVRTDGELWYDGRAYIVAVANGKTFGHGMRIAPHAQYNDGLLDVVLVEGMPRAQIIRVLNTVYTGDHLKRHDVHWKQARVVEVESEGEPMGLELDGESGIGQRLHFEVLPSALNILASQATA